MDYFFGKYFYNQMTQNKNHNSELPRFDSDSDDSKESPTVGSTVSESFFKSH